MPTITDSAKDIAYTAVGLNVLAYDELKARLAERGFDVAEQVAIARKRAKAHRTRWQHQIDETGEQLQERMRPVTEPVSTAIAPVRRSLEETVNRFAPARRDAAHVGEVVKDAAGDVAGAVKDTASDVAEALKATVGETPKPKTTRARKAAAPRARTAGAPRARKATTPAA